MNGRRANYFDEEYDFDIIDNYWFCYWYNNNEIINIGGSLSGMII